ncbi:hypothetical protein V4R08_15055 [Nitrobacter sp. NHB1]|uniref:hypothetical protein n=1 Tax=Nitrobacter sp. NHB1 TaxID=3119830 RepID=UPI002FFEEFF5
MRVLGKARQHLGEDRSARRFLETLGFDYVIRFRGNIHVTAADGETRAAAAWFLLRGLDNVEGDGFIWAIAHRVELQPTS